MGDANVQEWQGTWQFMSGVLVYFKTVPHMVEDDLESFFWVLVWVAVMYSPSTLTEGAQALLMGQTFNPEAVERSGGHVKAMFLQAPMALRTMRFQDERGNNCRGALKELCLRLAGVLAGRYSGGESGSGSDSWEAFTAGPKATHGELRALFERGPSEKDWPEKDGWRKQGVARKEEGSSEEWGRWATKMEFKGGREGGRAAKRQRTERKGRERGGVGEWDGGSGSGSGASSEGGELGRDWEEGDVGTDWDEMGSQGDVGEALSASASDGESLG